MYLQNIIPITHSPTKQLRTYFTTCWWFDLSFFGNLLNHPKSVEFLKNSQVGSFRGGEIRPRRSLRDERFGGDARRVAIHGWSLMKKSWMRLVGWYFFRGRWFKDRFWRTVESWENPGRLLGKLGKVVVKFWEGGTMLETPRKIYKKVRKIQKKIKSLLREDFHNLW